MRFRRGAIVTTQARRGAVVTTRPRLGAVVVAVVLAAARLADAQTEWLDRADRALAVDVAGGRARLELSALFDLEGYWIDQRPPGLIFGGDGPLVNPRLSLFLDTHLGRHLYSLVQARFDRGFDPRSESSSFRFDQYLLRYAPLADARLNVQVGKFATVIGNWVARHDSWNNPLINAPLPYENVTIVSDVKAPASRDEFLDRRRIADKKYEWVPLIWGPSYTTGAAVFGHGGNVDYALEVKNAAPSSRPEVWDARSRGFTRPTVSGRLGWRPSAAWALGASLSGGSYLREKSAATLAAGHHLGDYRQLLAAADASYGWRHVQLWGEVMATRFEVPRVGDADTLAYYLEGRYKLTPRLFAALRWNQQFFGDVESSAGDERAWDRDIWRVDTALGCRFDRHLQGKIQYSYAHQRGDVQQGEQLVAAQLTVKF
jgi:hypothetical protein